MTERPSDLVRWPDDLTPTELEEAKRVYDGQPRTRQWIANAKCPLDCLCTYCIPFRRAGIDFAGW